MTKRSARIAQVTFLCAIAVACDATSATASYCCFGLSCSPCDPDALSLSPSAQQYVLLGDTVLFVASTSGYGTGFEWSKSSEVIAFVRSPEIGGPSSVAVRGTAVGSSSISVKRAGRVATTPIDVIPLANLSNINVARQYCAGTPAILCDPRFGTPFRDTASVGDTIRVTADVKDFAGHTIVVNGPVNWSTSRASVAVPGVIVAVGGLFAGQYPFVVAVSRGSAVITSAVAGLTSSFTLVVQ